ncbi:MULTISPECIES: hypothetical protein [Burkholderia]|uniref:Uncharacterized protein n=1 Tax=Burkholderia pseudomultivorans TaxID=1207504 RepID=A0A6P2H4R2_9BURK|nr:MULTISPECIES: hypothetical protein [Burkholderia]HDR9035418.1 hypothetical protein [Burkholderia vietnamiensis]KVL14086.1 hypothetical protein WS95_23505 [Burkholderia sp. MSMB1826]MBU9312918.1 hypothetical protein [Burkholderia multivorans]QJP69070.1 hypothetical protein HJC54_01255 [Burkholderia glumae]VWB12036.1 hypothetical protein BPS26883_00400 [Burkholderia pseudomultivorans]
MLTADLPLNEKLKDLIIKLENDTLDKIVKGLDVRGQSYFAIRTGEIVSQVEEDRVSEALAKLNADHLLLLLVENNKGDDFKAGGTINIHIYTPKRSFEGYTDIYLDEDGARVVDPMEWQAWDGNIGYFK